MSFETVVVYIKGYNNGFVIIIIEDGDFHTEERLYAKGGAMDVDVIVEALYDFLMVISRRLLIDILNYYGFGICRTEVS